MEKDLTLFGKKFPARFIVKLLFASLLTIQVCKVTRFIPLQNLLSDHAISAGGYTPIFADVLKDRDLCAVGGRSWGYDPFLMAGYPAGAVSVLESRGAVVFDRLVRRWVSTDRSVKWMVFFSLLLPPVLVFIASLLLGATPFIALLAMALGVAGFGNYDYGSLYSINSGNTSFLLGCYLALVCFGAYVRLLKSFSAGFTVLFAATLSVMLLLSPVVFVSALVPFAILTWMNGSGISRKTAWSIAACWAAALVLNWFWIEPVLRFLPMLAPTRIIPKGPTQYFLEGNIERHFIRVALMVAAVAGLWSLRKKSTDVAVAFGIWIIALFAFAAAGDQIFFLSTTVSDHYFTLVAVVTLFPAALFLADWLSDAKSVRAFLFFWILWFQMTWQITGGNYRLKTGFSNAEARLIGELRRIKSTGRVLVETAPVSAPVAALLPFVAPNEYVGVTNVGTGIVAAGTTGFFSGWKDTWPATLFGKPLKDYDRDELLDILRQYNISHVVAYSLRARSRFDRFPAEFSPIPLQKVLQNKDQDKNKEKESGKDSNEIEIENEEKDGQPEFPPRVDPFRIYEVKSHRPGRLPIGSGIVTADYNQIKIMNPSRGEILLPYHWMETLQAPEGVRMTPRQVGEDVVPFIFLINDSDAKEIIITNRFR